MKRASSLTALLVSLTIAWGCDRKPEDLEVWRTAEGGYEKLAEWAKSAEEPDAVRIRAIEILIEENQVSDLKPLFDGMADDATRAKFADAIFPTVDKLWQTQDQPKLTDDVKENGGQIKVGDSKAVVAKDVAYFMQPYAQARKADYENILATWMSADQDLRTQLGATTVGQVMPRAGAGGMEAMKKWLGETAKPATVQRNVMEFAKDDKAIMGEVANILVKRANEKHPDIEGELEVALLENEHPNLLPYLEKAINDPKAPNKLKDGFMDAIVRIQGEKATPFFAEVVRTQNGLLRWVAAQRIIELRGKAGILVAANALPLEFEAYADEDLKKETEFLCNFISTEMKEQGVDSISTELKRALESERWPVRVVALRCAEITQDKSIKSNVEALSGSKDALPAFGDAKMTIGKFASEVAGKL
ncbi:MAG: hypothetical protein R3E66_24340 [bacterium]